MNRMLVTSLLAATQRIVAEIARCQSQTSIEGQPLCEEMLHEARQKVVSLTADEWVRTCPDLRKCLRVLLLMQETEPLDLIAEWPAVLLQLNGNTLMTGEISELLSALLSQSAKKSNQLSVVGNEVLNTLSPDSIITMLVDVSNRWWIQSKRSLELSRLNAQLVVEQGRLDSACEERVRLLAQKTKASATERVGRKMLDFLLEYRANWDARLLAHSEYVIGLAIESSLCAAFLAYGTAFSPSARNMLKRLIYADAISRALIADPGASLIECMLPMHDETLLHRLLPERDRNSHFRESVLAVVIGSSTSVLIDPHGLALSWLETHEDIPDSISSQAVSTDDDAVDKEGAKSEIEGNSHRGEPDLLEEVAMACSLMSLLPQSGFPSAQGLVYQRKQNIGKSQPGAPKPQSSGTVSVLSVSDPGLRTAVLAAAERGRLTIIVNITSDEQLAEIPAGLLLPPALKRLKRPRTIDPENSSEPEEKRVIMMEYKGSEVLRIHPNFRLVLVVRHLSQRLAGWIDTKHGISVVDFSVQAANEHVLTAALFAERPDLASQLRDLPREAEAAALRAAISELDLAEKLSASTGRIITDPVVFTKIKDLRTSLIDANAEVELNSI